jgi:preprotein translocase subunit YajC
MDLSSVAYAMGISGAGAGGQQGGGLVAMAPLLLMVVVFYFLLIRPQQKKQKEHKAMLSNLQKGDVICTQGGLQGKITGLTDTLVTLEIADKVRVKVQRGYIATVLSKGEPVD